MQCESGLYNCEAQEMSDPDWPLLCWCRSVGRDDLYYCLLHGLVVVVVVVVVGGHLYYVTSQSPSIPPLS